MYLIMWCAAWSVLLFDGMCRLHTHVQQCRQRQGPTELLLALPIICGRPVTHPPNLACCCALECRYSFAVPRAILWQMYLIV